MIIQSNFERIILRPDPDFNKITDIPVIEHEFPVIEHSHQEDSHVFYVRIYIEWSRTVSNR